MFLDQETTDPALQDAVVPGAQRDPGGRHRRPVGQGLARGRLTNGRYVPVMWADFPFAAVGEQFGLVGCAPCCSACS